MTQEISLSDLKGEIPPAPVSTKDLVGVSIEDMAPPRQEEPLGKEFKENLLSDLDITIERLKKEATQRQEDLLEKVLEQKSDFIAGLEAAKEKDEYADEDNLEDDDMDLSLEEPTIDSTPKKKVNTNSNTTRQKKKIIEDDLESDDDDEFLNDLDDADKDELENGILNFETKTDEEKKESFKKSLNDTIIQPIKNKIDLEQFKVSKKPTTVSRITAQTVPTERTADWILPSTKKQFTIAEFKGSEIERLDPRNSSSNRYNTFKNIYGLIYSHIRDDDKPSFESWLKLVNFTDITHLYFGAYKASFDNINYVPCQCSNKKCEEMFLAEADINDIIKYKTPEDKEEIDRLLQDGSTITKDDEYEITRYQISDDYVIDIKQPSIYNVLFETASISEDFATKYSDLLGMMTYIDAIYYINKETNELDLIESKVDVKSKSKTLMRRYKTYYDILSKLSSDQYYLLSQHLLDFDEVSAGLYYVNPETTCPVCGTLILEEAMVGEQLLFIRHRLGALANS